MATEEFTYSHAAQLLKVIADETRLRILGSLAEGRKTGKDLAEALQLTPPTISHHIRKLTDVNIVLVETEAQRHWYTLNRELLQGTRRLAPSPAEIGESAIHALPGDTAEDAAFRSKVVRDFFDGERLRSIPAQRKRRVIILQHLLQRFAPDRTYAEREVNELLKTAYDDFATLRRELVDYGYMQRERGIYQVSRAGPARDERIAQEITGNEQSWLQSMLDRVIRAPVDE